MPDFDGWHPRGHLNIEVKMSLTNNIAFKDILATEHFCSKPVKWGFKVSPEIAHKHLSQLAQYLFDVALETLNKNNLEGYQKYSAMSDCVSELHEELLSVEVQR